MAIGQMSGGGASLQTLDQIRDALIARGIGTSGLAKQAIKRANLPTLHGAVMESQATQSNFLDQIRAKAQTLGFREQVKAKQLEQKSSPNLLKPFAIGQTTPYGQGLRSVAIATPTSGGQFKLSSETIGTIGSDQEFQERRRILEEMGILGKTELPTISTQYMYKKPIASLADLQREFAKIYASGNVPEQLR